MLNIRRTSAVCLLLSLILCLSSLLASCGGADARDDLASADLSGKVLSALPDGRADEYTAAGEKFVSSSSWGEDYETMLALLTDYRITIARNADRNVDEIGILHVKNPSDVKKVRKFVGNYIKLMQERMPDILEMYNPNEIPKIENASVTVCGNYILYTVLDSADEKTVRQAFEKALKPD